MELRTKLLDSYEVLSSSLHCENIQDTYQDTITYNTRFLN